MKVVNIYHYDSDNSDDNIGGGGDVIENIKNVRPSTPDETTIEMSDILTEKLSEICNTSCLGLNMFRIDFYDTNFEFESKSTRCDFDVDDYDIPIIFDGAQNFIIPYLSLLSETYDDLKGCTFETNKNFTFKI